MMHRPQGMIGKPTRWRPVEIEVPTRVRAILSDVARLHGFTVADIQGPVRKRKLVWARQEAMWLFHLLERPKPSLTRIGIWLGGRDHTTVIHGIRAHAERMGRSG